MGYGPVDAAGLRKHDGRTTSHIRGHMVSWYDVCADSKIEAARMGLDLLELDNEKYAYLATSNGAAYYARNHKLPRDITRRINRLCDECHYGYRNQRVAA